MAIQSLSNMVENMWFNIVIVFLTIIFIIYLFFKHKYSYWQRQGFPVIQGTMPWGSLTDFIMMKSSIAKTVSTLYHQTQGYTYIGYYSLWSPTLLIRDPELIKRVLVKDFNYFSDRGMYHNDEVDPLSNNLVSMNGVKWKSTRAKLVSMFSNSRIKTLYQNMKSCSIQLSECINEFIEKGKDVINFKSLISRHAVNVIANSAIGVEGYSLKEETYLFQIAVQTTAPTLIQGFRWGLSLMAKDFAKLIKMRFTPKSVENYYLEMAKQIVEYRTKNNVVRNDFMNMLIELWDKRMTYEKIEKPVNETSLSLRDIAAQTFLFILAAYESTASTICFALYELAYNQEIQDKLRSEIDSAGTVESITNDELVQLKYLTMVLNETWRKYPPGGLLLRECQSDYQLPDGNIVKKGVIISIPVDGLHKDPEYFPDPERFDPERFNKDSPTHNIQPFTYLPFGEGQRNCIGKRYGTIQTMITLFSLISNFKFEIAEKTQVPPKIDPKIFVTQAEGGMYLKAIYRKKDI